MFLFPFKNTTSGSISKNLFSNTIISISLFFKKLYISLEFYFRLKFVI